MFDREKFIKVMMLTSSPDPGERSAALHRGLEMMKAAKLNWEQVLSDRGASRSNSFQDSMREAELRQQVNVNREMARQYRDTAESLKRTVTELQAKLGSMMKQNANASRERAGPKVEEESSNPFEQPGHTYGDKTDIKEMLEACLANITGSAREFIQSLHDQFMKRGHLSYKQESALRKFYGNLSGV